MTTGSYNAVLEECVARWRAAGVSPRAPIGNLEVAAFEERYGVPLPEDVRSLFQIADGMDEGEADENGIHFWPLEQVAPALKELPAVSTKAQKDLFVFADYSIWTHGYAVRLSPTGRHAVMLVGGELPLVVADTFLEFLERYVTDPSSLFPAGRPG